MDEPTFVTIPVKNRHSMIRLLVAQLQAQEPDGIFIFDNDSDPPQPVWEGNGYLTAPIPAPGMGLHGMWNAGLALAEKEARKLGVERWNVVVMNSDVEVPSTFLQTLSEGLREADAWLAYPNVYNVDPSGIYEMHNPELAHQTIAGWAWMLAGESGLRVDENLTFWYGDADIEAQVRKAGKKAVCVGNCFALHLDANGSVTTDAKLRAAVEDDERYYAEKWGLDPESLFLAQNPGWAK